MPRPVETALWLSCAIVAIGCYFLSGFYGWASVLVWTVVAFPLIVMHRRRSVVGTDWPSRALVRVWMVAVTASVLTGFGLLFRPRAPRVVEWAMVVVAWTGFIASAVVISRVTYVAVVRPGRAA
jgi:hypothetical protein